MRRLEMQLKQDVKLKDLQPPTLIGLFITLELWRATFGSIEFMITSVNDGKHMQNSLHYKGCAFDCRTHTILGDNREALIKGFHDKLAINLGPNFDTLLEDLGTPNEHIHVEYDPK